jgi:cell division protease FtsH
MTATNEQRELEPPAGQGGVPAPSGAPEFKSRERDEDRLTRKPLDFWDRIKLVLLFVGSWFVVFWASLAQFDPAISTREAFNQTMRSYWWLIALAVLEVIRQTHYFVSEHSARWHKAWTGLFARVEKRTGRMKDWTRFRLARVLKALFLLVIIDLVLAKIYHLPPATALIQLPIAITKALPIAFQFAFGFLFIMIQFIGLFWFLSKGGVDVYMPDDIKTRFSDVRGQDAVLSRVKENIIFLDDPESIEEKGGYVPGGILLWGPPGTGKTLMAQAVAGETSKPFVFVDPGSFIQMFFGVGILKVKSLYRKARRLALRHGGVIMFFDEADSLGNRGSMGAPGGWTGITPSPWDQAGCNGLAYLSRESVSMLLRDSLPSGGIPEPRGTADRIIAGMGMGGGGGMGTLQALLAEMSGLKKPRGFFNRVIRRMLGMRPKPPPKYRILHIFATNRPDVLDEAMLRPGRIDRIYKVGYPAKDGRRQTYVYYLAKVKHVLTPDQIEKLSVITPYATGAGIQDMVNEALVIAVRDGREAIEWKDILRAKQLKEHGLPDDTEYIERERHAVAVHEACHAVVSYRLRKHAIIDMATIERRGDVGGFVSFIPPEDRFVNWKSEYEVDIIGSLASLAGERIFFDEDHSAGVSGDMRNATGIATLMEAYIAMGSTLASHRITKFGITTRGAYAAEDGTDRNLFETELGKRVENRLQELYQRTRTLLEENRREVLAVAHALETEKTISGDDVAAIIEGVPGPLVDGRSYVTTEFAEQAEDYHREAVVAHKGHAEVNLPLPVLVPAAGEGDGRGNGEVPARPDAPGNGEVRNPPAVAEGNGAGSVEAGAGGADPEPAAEGEPES